jgi:hypothetical protein
MVALRYVHLGKLVTPLSCEDLADLAVAADHFLVGTLKHYCSSELKKKMTTDDVWPVLDRVLKVGLDNVVESCAKVFCHFS